MNNATHFVGFKDDRFLTAIRFFGKPDFIHRVWDQRAIQEVFPGDRVIFATGDENQKVIEFTWDDSSRF